MTLALQAFWKGLMYDAATLDEALRLAPRLNQAEALSLREAVARDALDARDSGVDVLSVAKEIVSLAAKGLNSIAPEEVNYMDVLLQQVVEDDSCPADVLLRNWGGGYFGINDRGNLVCHPSLNPSHGIDVKALVDELVQRGLSMPLLIRFSDILKSRIELLNECFKKAIAEYEALARAAPRNPDFVFRLAEALIQRGDRKRALEQLRALEARAGPVGRALFAADFLEPGRELRDEWRRELRPRMPAEIDAGVKENLQARVIYLVGEGRPVRGETMGFWNAMAGGKPWARASEV
jgi:tetratricopeptide (TPR) repeat protein